MAAPPPPPPAPQDEESLGPELVAKKKKAVPVKRKQPLDIEVILKKKREADEAAKKVCYYSQAPLANYPYALTCS